MEHTEYAIHAPYQIGAAIDSQREVLGISRREFCRMVNLSYRNYSRTFLSTDSNLTFSRIFTFFSPLILAINGCFCELQLVALFARRMRALHITQAKLAEYACVSQALVSRFFARGRQRRRTGRIPSSHASSGISIAVALDIDLCVHIRCLEMLAAAKRDLAFASVVDGAAAEFGRNRGAFARSRAVGPPSSMLGARGSEGRHG